MSWRGMLLKSGISSDGRNVDIVGALTARNLLPLPGNVWYVDYRNGDDDNTGKSWAKALQTYSQAIDKVTTNNNDYILVDGDSTVVETAMVDLSKNRVHTVGMNGVLGHFGQGAKISCTLAAGATNIATFKNTGVRNTFTGIKWLNANTVAQGLYSVAEGGEYARYFNCEFYKSSDLTETAAAELLLNGDSAMFYGCTLGSTANIIASAKIRPNVLLTRQTLTGKVCRDCLFDDCLFLSKAGGTEHVAVYGANATDVERMLIIKNSIFLNNILSAATPAHAVGFAAAQTHGSVLLKNCSSVDFTVMAQAAMSIYVDGAVPTFATSGVAKAA